MFLQNIYIFTLVKRIVDYVSPHKPAVKMEKMEAKYYGFPFWDKYTMFLPGLNTMLQVRFCAVVLANEF